MPTKRRAACCVVIRGSKVLAISRGEDTNDWSVPGGAIEKRESLREAARRELLEETGVRIGPYAKMHLVGDGISDNYATHFFAIEGDIYVPNQMRSTPFEGYPAWQHPQVLCEAGCSFAAIQKELFKSLGIL